MPSPRADFSCRSCAKAAGEDGLHVHADLPVESQRCPIRGTKISRLYNAVNIGSATARAHDKILESSTIPAQLEAAKAAEAAKAETPVLKIGGAGALGAVRNHPGAVGASQGVSLPIIRSLGAPRPGAGSRDG